MKIAKISQVSTIGIWGLKVFSIRFLILNIWNPAKRNQKPSEDFIRWLQSKARPISDDHSRPTKNWRTCPEYMWAIFSQAIKLNYWPGKRSQTKGVYINRWIVIVYPILNCLNLQSGIKDLTYHVCWWTIVLNTNFRWNPTKTLSWRKAESAEEERKRNNAYFNGHFFSLVHTLRSDQ